MSYVTPLESYLSMRSEVAATVYQICNEPAVEEFAPLYFDYPDALAGLVKSMARLELALKKLQKAQAQNVVQRVNLSGLRTFDEFDNLFISFVWEQDQQDLTNVFTKLLPDALAAGALMSQQELGFVIDFDPNDLPSQRYLERHIPKLAGEITDTTKERVRNRIKQGLLAGKNRDEMAADLADIFDSPTRRRTIAQTESVQAFSEGRIQAGIAMGATEKVWRAQINRCPICDALDGERAPIDDTFSGGYNSAPAHPNCKCGVALSFGEANDTAHVSDPAAIEERQQRYLQELK